MLHVNIIGKSNGVGLDRDALLLAAVLSAAGCNVVHTWVGSRQSSRRKSRLFDALCALLRRPAPRYDVNVMLEHVWTQYLHNAKTNLLVPNPDFFDKHDVRAVPRVNWVWAKTIQAEQLFRNMGIKVIHTGFDSEDRLLADVPRQRTFFHLVGSSVLKGTERLLRVWNAHPHWPILIVAGRLRFQPPVASNVRIYDGYLEDDFLKRLQNESLVHICLSEAEGWGHYLVEAMSVGAAVITVDAPPMNELITPDRGWLIACHPNGKQRLVTRQVFDEQAFVRLINHIITLPDETVTKLGQAGRVWYEGNRRSFSERVEKALNTSTSDSQI